MSRSTTWCRSRSVGLLKAVERFDPDRGLEFSTFATATVEGELKRHFRDKTWSVRVPRRSQELHLRIGPTVAELSQRLGRPPRIPEIAPGARHPRRRSARSDGSRRRVPLGVARRARRRRPRSERARPAGSVRPTRNFDLVEHRVVIERALDSLPEREQTILRLRFFEDLTQAEIADQVGVSQMHVSRLLARSLAEPPPAVTHGRTLSTARKVRLTP